MKGDDVIMKRKCFVIMPFSKTSEKHTEQYWTNFFNVVKREIEYFDYDCFRSETGPYNILKNLIVEINESDLVVAILTDLNPNVWYELGIRHALKTGTIMLIEKEQKVPFDISQYSLIKYNDDISLSNYLNKEFGTYISKLSNKNYCDSPVIDSIDIPVKLQEKFEAMYHLILKIANEDNVQTSNNITRRKYKRILWVDDYPSNNASIISLFENKIEFDIAISTTQGIKLLQDKNFDLIITDIGRGNEPEAGIDLIKQIKSYFPQFQTPIVVFSSSRAIGMYGNKAQKLGAFLVTNKTSEVISVISQTLE